MTETEIAAQIPTWQMPLAVQELCLYLFGGFSVLCLGIGIWLGIKQKSWMPLAWFLAAVVTVNLEPVICRVASASHAQIGQITAFVSEGRLIPWHAIFAYLPYFGFGYYFLVPALQARKIGARKLWVGYFAIVVVAWVFEAPFIKAGLWGYFGPQSLQPYGLMPIYFAFVNTTTVYAPCALLAATMPLLSGLGRLWIILLAPAYTIGVHFAVAWPMYNLRTSAFPIIGSHIGAAMTIVLCVFSTYLTARVFARR